jgi:hypothetical protein
MEGMEGEGGRGRERRGGATSHCPTTPQCELLTAEIVEVRRRKGGKKKASTK